MAIKQWEATVQVEAAYNELRALKAKYPWMKCDRSLSALEKLSVDLPKIVTIIAHQDKQNAIHTEFVRVSQFADKAIVETVAKKFGIEI